MITVSVDFFGCLDFRIFGFLDFRIFGFWAFVEFRDCLCIMNTARCGMKVLLNCNVAVMGYGFI